MNNSTIVNLPYVFKYLKTPPFSLEGMWSCMAKMGEGVWNLILAGSMIGILAALTDLFYHISIGETEEVLGFTPLENITHPLPFVIYVVFLLVYLWHKIKSND